MKIDTAYSALWRTASYSDTPDTQQHDAATLQQHLSMCQQVYGRLHRLRHHTYAVLRFLYTHVVTALLLMALVLGLASLVL